MSDKEIFKAFPYHEFTDRYMVSNQGRIWSNRKSDYITSAIVGDNEVISINKLNSKQRVQFSVDKVVAETFHGLSNLYLEHIDKNPLNNKADNLRWVTLEDYLKNTHGGIWKEIEKHPKYLVSDQGQIWSAKSEIIIKDRVIAGYKSVNIGTYPNQKFYHVHRLVAKAFLDNPNNYPYVNHKSSDIMDNKAENLEWSVMSKRGIIKNKPEIQEMSDKPIIGAELDWLPGYLITTDGKVYSKKLERFLTNSLNASGYYRVHCSVPGVSRQLFVHKLVAEAWLPIPISEKTQVNHKDLNRTNNDFQNLEWVSPSENTKHSVENNPDKFSHLQKPILCLDKNTEEIITEYKGLKEATRATGINSGSISRVCRNLSKSAGGYKWKYA